ncbi:Hypothetical predicted protein [Lecanosticta acicola]|uniref:Uncharacterized protein n=1 Tax=Lecanosticta acicola TaxID=111012 RepID=A0AAI8Z8C9_9PEZI|nr:Hypothetical predicted protein [Lecanosticta acicola]
MSQKRRMNGSPDVDRGGTTKKLRMDSNLGKGCTEPYSYSFEGDHDHDANPVVSRPATAAASAPKIRKGPFIIDDSSDDEAEPNVLPTEDEVQKTPGWSYGRETSASSALIKQEAKSESERMRVRALAKRNPALTHGRPSETNKRDMSARPQAPLTDSTIALTGDKDRSKTTQTRPSDRRPFRPLQTVSQSAGSASADSTVQKTASPAQANPGNWFLNQLKGLTEAAEQDARNESKRDEASRTKEYNRKRCLEHEEKAAKERQTQALQQRLLEQDQQREIQAQRGQYLQKQVLKQQEETNRREAEQAQKRATAKREEERELMKQRAALDEKQEKAAQERIRRQRERNASMAEDDNNEIIVEDPGQAPVQVSLASIARGLHSPRPPPTAAQNGSLRPDAAALKQARLNTEPKALSSPAGALVVSDQDAEQALALTIDQAVGEILPQDAKLLQWKDEGFDFSSIIPKFAEVSGARRTREWLRVRHFQLQNAIKNTAVDEKLLRKLANNEAEAVKQANILVHGAYPISFGDRDRDCSRKEHFLVKTPGQSPNNRVPLLPKPTPGQREVAEIRLRDVELVQWRDTGVQWPEIRKRYFDKYEDEWSENRFRARYKQLKEALQTANVGVVLLSRAANKDEYARIEINRMIHGEAFDKGKTIPTVRLSTKASIPPETEEKKDSARSATSIPAPPTPAQATRPTTGGKMLDENFYMALINQRHEAEESEEPEENEVGETNDCYWIYRVFRRELDPEQLENLEELDQDDEWIECAGEELYTHEEAYSRANREVFAKRPGSNVYASDTRELAFRQYIDDDGRGHLHLEISGYGRVETLIAREAKYLEPSRPAPAEAGMRSVHWQVRQLVTTIHEPADEMFDEREKITELTLVEGGANSDLTEANKVAARQWVELTFRSQSRNLNEREAEKKETFVGLLDELEDNEDEPFNRTSEDGKLKVWVERVVVNGPSN